jgi:hypothetical protein
MFLASAVVAFGITAASAQVLTVTPEIGAEFHTYVTTEKIAPVDIDVDFTVGAVLPDAVVLEPIPDVIVTKAPEFKGYRYAYIGDRIVIADAASPKVVAVID